MPLDYDIFEQALDLFHRYSLQNDEAVRRMQAVGILPAVPRTGFSVLDIGAGQGHLPSLMRAYADSVALLEPNPRCVALLRESFDDVLPCPWGDAARQRLREQYPAGFDLITMSHMLYHLDGLDDIRDKLRMALTLLKPGGRLGIILNRPSAPMARIGMAYQLATGRSKEWQTNQDLHSACHDPGFYRDLADGRAEVAIYPVDAPLRGVKSREELTVLFRMPLLNPLSDAPCDTAGLDRFIGEFLDSEYPDLDYPADIPSQDELIVIGSASA